MECFVLDQVCSVAREVILCDRHEKVKCVFVYFIKTQGGNQNIEICDGHISVLCPRFRFSPDDNYSVLTGFIICPYVHNHINKESNSEGLLIKFLSLFNSDTLRFELNLHVFML